MIPIRAINLICGIRFQQGKKFYPGLIGSNCDGDKYSLFSNTLS